jgi:carotenoid cleavage dioxygenase
MRFFPDQPTRLGLFDRRKHELLRWFEVPACYVYHFANAWEQGDEVVIHVCRMRDPLMYDPQPGRSDTAVPRIAHLRLEPELVRWTLNLSTGLAKEEVIDDGLAEFPRVDDRKIGAPTRAAYLASFAEDEALHFQGVRRVDLQSGAAVERDFPAGWHGGEVSVAPLSTDGDAAVLASFVTEADTGRSELWLLNADDLATVARLAIPSRVPVGFHTRWLPGA